jgi:hypothetical protein
MVLNTWACIDVIREYGCGRARLSGTIRHLRKGEMKTIQLSSQYDLYDVGDTSLACTTRKVASLG